jgi:hypothetical protein
MSDGVGRKLNLVSVAQLSDVDAWNAMVPVHLNMKLWPFHPPDHSLATLGRQEQQNF